MAKKVIALLLAMCMCLSVCSFGIFAEEALVAEDPTGASESATDSTEAGTDSTENATDSTENETDEVVVNSVDVDMKNSYFANETVKITGTVSGNVSGVIVVIKNENGRVEFEETVNKSKFESTGVSHKLEDAEVGSEYTVEVYNFDDETELLFEGTFLIKRSGTNTDTEDDGSNKIRIWIEGTTERYVDETVINLSVLDEHTVFDAAEYLLEDVDRNYKDNKKKITAIASTETGSTYTLKDGATSRYFEDCVWSFFLNGVAYYDDDWTDVSIKGGDEIILYFGEPGEVGYPVVTITPDDGISLKDEVEILVENQITDPDTGEVTKEPMKGAKVYIKKRGATSNGTAKTTDANGIYDFDATSSWLSSYQGGEVLVALYQTSSKPLKMVSVSQDLKTDRDGSVQAYVRIEGAHKTLLKRTKSSKIEEFDLYNFMLEVLEDEDIEYEVNNDETNFIYFESKTTSGYSNENGDLVRDSGWYVVVNDDVYTPDDDLEDVEIYSNDEILFYFGDEDTVPVVYYKVDGDLKPGKKVYVYFYSDAKMTDPIDDLDVEFEGTRVSKKLSTNSDGRITLPTVSANGTYTLSWGEQVGVRDDYCPTAIMGTASLKYSGGAASDTGTGTTNGRDDDDDDEEETEKRTERETEKKTEKDDDWEIETEKKTEKEIEVETWAPTDFKTDKPTDSEDLPLDNNKQPQSYLYPDTNFDWWAVPNVEKAYKYDLMKGTTYGYFEPLRDITRAEFTTIVCRILGLDTTSANYNQKFTDVKKTDWHYGYIMAAYSAGFVAGKSDTTFNPNDYITREEIAVLIARIINVQGNAADTGMYVDSADISSWAKEGVAAANKTGIMTGDQFNQFLPKSNVNRQTVATIAVRLYEYLGN